MLRDPLALCAACQADLPWLTHQCCPHCAAAVPSPGPCGRCLTRSCRLDHAWCAWRYLPPMQHFIHQLKFNRKLLYAKLLGTLMAEAWQRSEHPNPQAIIPVPLHRKRLQSRGYNQAAEIAKHIASVLQIRYEPSLIKRQIDTATQTSLSASARQRNLRQAFKVMRPIPYQHVVIIDDVMTTGATVHALMQTLKEHGVAQVDAWAACRAELRLS